MMRMGKVSLLVVLVIAAFAAQPVVVFGSQDVHGPSNAIFQECRSSEEEQQVVAQLFNTVFFELGAQIQSNIRLIKLAEDDLEKLKGGAPYVWVLLPDGDQIKYTRSQAGELQDQIDTWKEDLVKLYKQFIVQLNNLAVAGVELAECQAEQAECCSGASGIGDPECGVFQ